jgi:hypothetical protein
MQKFHLQIKKLLLIFGIAAQQRKLGYVPNFPSMNALGTTRFAPSFALVGTPIAIHWHISLM